jgi:Protein of unknown function (DUF2384)
MGKTEHLLHRLTRRLWWWRGEFGTEAWRSRHLAGSCWPPATRRCGRDHRALIVSSASKALEDRLIAGNGPGYQGWDVRMRALVEGANQKARVDDPQVARARRAGDVEPAIRVDRDVIRAVAVLGFGARGRRCRLRDREGVPILVDDRDRAAPAPDTGARSRSPPREATKPALVAENSSAVRKTRSWRTGSLSRHSSARSSISRTLTAWCRRPMRRYVGQRLFSIGLQPRCPSFRANPMALDSQVCCLYMDSYSIMRLIMASQETDTLWRSEEGLPFAERHDPAVRERLSGPGLRTFFNIASEWGLTVNQQRVLLGGVPSSTYHKWKGGTVGTLSYDQLERISLVLGIYKALKLLFADDASGARWLKAANTDLPFAGASPLDRMLHGSIDDLYAVRRYLDSWRGGWP